MHPINTDVCNAAREDGRAGANLTFPNCFGGVAKTHLLPKGRACVAIKPLDKTFQVLTEQDQNGVLLQTNTLQH